MRNFWEKEFKFHIDGVVVAECEAYALFSQIYADKRFSSNIWANLNAQACRLAVIDGTKGRIVVSIK